MCYVKFLTRKQIEALNLITGVNYRDFIKINKLNEGSIVKKRENVRTKNIFDSKIFLQFQNYISN
jgi:hypothetical protein